MEDLTNALFAMSTWRLPRDCLICNIGGGQPTTLLQLVGAIEAVGRRKARLEFTTARSFDVGYSCLDIERIAALYNWRPRYNLASGLAASLPQIAQGTYEGFP